MQIAVDFEHALARVARAQVQAVDVLRDERMQIAAPLELDQRRDDPRWAWRPTPDA